MNKVFKIVVNPDDETGVDFNSFVDVPAHMKGFMAFGKNQPVKYSFNDEKRMVTGVMISAGTLIYRFSEDIGEHYVVFDAETIDVIRKKFFVNGYNQNLNTDHNPNKVTQGAVLVDSYIISNTDPKFPKAPEAFSKLNLNDGTWIATYHVTDDKLWQDVKDGKFNGFSVEGWFEKQEIKTHMKNEKIKMAKGKFGKISQVTKWDIEINQDSVEVGSKLTTTYKDFNDELITYNVSSGEYTLENGKRILVDSDGIVRFEFQKQEINLKTKMNKQKKSIWDLFKKDSKAKETFATATTAEGVAVMYDGELEVGTALSVEADGVTIPAPEGEHQLTLEDGSVKIVVLNAEGVVESVQDFEANTEEDEELNSIREEVAEAMTELAKEIHSRFDAVEAENKRLTEENEALKAEFKSIKESDKFGASPKVGTQNTDGKLTIKEIVSKKKN